MKQIEQTYAIKAPVDKVWQALTDANVAQEWGAAPAEVDAVEGGKFSYWGGDIHGVFTALVPDELIEQDWSVHDHPGRTYKARFDFETNGEITTVHLTFSGEIEDEEKEIKDWEEYYFDPIKELLES